MNLHPVIWLCWLLLAVCVAIVAIAFCLEWWERRQDARTYQTRTRHHRLNDPDRSVFTLPAAEFDALMERLDAPPRDNPRLRALLSDDDGGAA